MPHPGEPIIRVSAHPRTEGAYFSRINTETLGADEAANRRGAAGQLETRVEELGRLVRRGEMIAVDVRVDRGDGLPNVLDGNPLWMLADREKFEQRVQSVLGRTWLSTPYGRSDSPIFVSSAVPQIEIDVRLDKRLRRGRRWRWWR